MKQESITAWAWLVTGMIISELVGIVMRSFSLDKYSLWLIFAFYTLVIVTLVIEREKKGD
jgi:cell division protein FtsW (lipid II flippase)